MIHVRSKQKEEPLGDERAGTSWTYRTSWSSWRWGPWVFLVYLA